MIWDTMIMPQEAFGLLSKSDEAANNQWRGARTSIWGSKLGIELIRLKEEQWQKIL